jgi:hypothetical protein
MQMTNFSEQNALTTDKGATVLGINEFSLFTRIQMDEIEAERLPWGEVAISETELRQMLRTRAISLVVPPNQEVNWSDSDLGIQKHDEGIERNAESIEYSVPHYSGHFTENEIQGYRAAFGSIASQFNALNGLKMQLDKLDALPTNEDAYAHIGRWKMCAKLLNLGQSEVLLYRLSGEFAVIERFQDESVYAKNNNGTEVLLKGNHIEQLVDDFKANAHHTLRFMACNLTAKAQKIVWEKFPDSKPGEIMAAISERCRQAVQIDETLEVQFC